jgi:hypothetical protein
MLLSCTQQLARTITITCHQLKLSLHDSFITAPADLQHYQLSSHAGNASLYLYLH